MARSSGNVRQLRTAAARAISWGLLALVGAGAACSDDADVPEGLLDGPETCVAGGGPVSGAADAHCVDDAGSNIVQNIGACTTEAVLDGEGDEDEEGEEEELGVFYGNQAYDDDCKYRVSFTHSCIVQNQPVTFNVTLLRNSDGSVATGAMPSTVEAYMEDGHISPSNRFTGPERTPGTYAIGPVEFDRPGRWVVRFHFFETCSDIPEDSPHGHTAFYIDVP